MAMDTPTPAKRRKLSPSLSVPGGEDVSPLRSAKFPARSHPATALPPTQTGQYEDRGASNTGRSPAAASVRAEPTPTSASRTRQSFMSPTKASLARFNPTLLRRPRSAGGGSDTSRSPTKGGRERSLDPEKIRGMLARRNEETGSTLDQNASQVLSSTVLDSQPTPRSGGRLGGRFANRPRRRSERASEPPELGENGTTERATTANKSPRTSNKNTTRAHSYDPASDPTALNSQLENELQSSASREIEPLLRESEARLSRLAGAASPGMSSSPLARATRKAVRRQISPAKKIKPIVPDLPEVQKETGGQESTEEAADAATVGTKVEQSEKDPETRRKEEKLEKLRKQLDAIREDVNCLRDGARHLQQSKGKSVGAQSEANAIIAVITSKDPSHRFLSKPKDPPLSARLALYLPFSRIKPSELHKPTPAETNFLENAYRPVELDESDLDIGLDQGQAATLTVQEDLPSVLSDSTSVEVTRQITLRTPAPTTASLSLDVRVNPVSDSVLSLSIATIPSWAEQEYGTWARQISISGDISVLGRAFILFTRLDFIRARVWRECCHRFNHLLKHLGPLAAEMAAQNSKKNTDEDLRYGSVHSGRQSLTFHKEGVSVRVDWIIGFDWTGEPESRVDLVSSTPQSWRNVDKRGSLGKLGKVFRQLVEERGMESAIGIVWGVVFESEKG